jgi:hypothetical protein
LGGAIAPFFSGAKLAQRRKEKTSTQAKRVSPYALQPANFIKEEEIHIVLRWTGPNLGQRTAWPLTAGVYAEQQNHVKRNEGDSHQHPT